MKPSGAPRSELARAQVSANAIHTAQSFTEFNERWVGFLHHLERIWFKSEAHFGKSPKWNGWKGRYERDRKRDPLLRYLRNARGAEEHTIAPLAANAAIRLMPSDSGSEMPNFTFEIGTDGNLQVKSDGPFNMVWHGGGAQLLDIVNRGVTYTVPSSHLGQKVNPSDLQQILAFALVFYRHFLDEAEKAFYE